VKVPGHRIISELAERTGEKFNTAACAAILDKEDPLGHLREKFIFPEAPSGGPSIYLCGNSLGLQSTLTVPYVNEELEKWQRFGVEGHFSDVNTVRPWVTADEDCRDDMAAIVGAKPFEVAIMNSLTANLHLLMAAFYKPVAGRFKILMEGKAFPSDKFALQSQASLHGYDPAEAIVEMWPRDGEKTLRTEDIVAKIQSMGNEISVVVFGGIQYYTGQLFDMEAITKAGHAAGCKVGFDLAHAVGNAPLKLNECGPDFACWCSYKYLNSGPGNIAGLFVHERYENDQSLTRLAGWWGHRKEDRFVMEHKFIASPGAQSFMLSNPSVLCIAALRASTDMFKEATMLRLREKSVKLTAYLESLIDTEFGGSVQILTPRDPAQRGAQLSLVFNVDVKKVQQAIAAQGVICDVREPDVMRIAPAPLYNSFTDVFNFVRLLKAELPSTS
jgi:kynureninase